MRLLDKLRNDRRVAKVYQDTDGWWLECAAGYRNAYDEPVGYLHGAHEDTLTALVKRLPDIVPCDCAECKALLNMKKT